MEKPSSLALLSTSSSNFRPVPILGVKLTTGAKVSTKTHVSLNFVIDERRRLSVYKRPRFNRRCFCCVQGVTIQGGPMIRTTDVAAMSAAYAKRRKKKKRRKQRRLATVSCNELL